MCTFLYWEELARLLARGRWNGTTLFEFLTETFDCPSEWGLSYKKQNAIHLDSPTPTILCGTTPEWFWKTARPEDFYGGFGNRFLYLSGTRKQPIPNPAEPDHEKLLEIRQQLECLRSIQSGRAVFDPDADKLWNAFYSRSEIQVREGLIAAAFKRIHVYIRKLAMTYAALEGTCRRSTGNNCWPRSRSECMRSAVPSNLIDARAKSCRPETELEQKFMKWVANHPGERVRTMQNRMWKYTGGAEMFNRVLKNLVQADRIDIRERRVYLSD